MDLFEVYAYWDSLENQPQFDIDIDIDNPNPNPNPNHKLSLPLARLGFMLSAGTDSRLGHKE